MQNRSVSCSIKAIVHITLLHAKEVKTLFNVELPINARKWETISQGGTQTFVVEANGWEVLRAFTPWKECLENNLTTH